MPQPRVSTGLRLSDDAKRDLGRIKRRLREKGHGDANDDLFPVLLRRAAELVQDDAELERLAAEMRTHRPRRLRQRSASTSSNGST
jgi:hypothetical protein